jgi:hypothetical protein
LAHHRYPKQRVPMVCCSPLLFLVLACGSESKGPYDGHWEGSSQLFDKVAFEVSDNMLAGFELESKWMIDPCTLSVTVEPHTKVTDGGFQFDFDATKGSTQLGATVDGAFTSGTKAQGNLGNITFSAACGGTSYTNGKVDGTDEWTAAKTN